MNTITKHCKKQYKVLVPYTDAKCIEVIEVEGKSYEIVRLPRPTKNVTELMCVFVNGIKYPTFAKFLKSIS